MTTIEMTNRKLIGETYQKIRQEVFSIFRQACIAEDTCNDLVQEVFIKLLSMDIIIEDQLKGLTITIAYQKRTDYLRRRAIINKVHDDLSWQMERSYTNADAEVDDILRVEMKAISCMSDMDCRIYQMARFEEDCRRDCA